MLREVWIALKHAAQESGHIFGTRINAYDTHTHSSPMNMNVCNIFMAKMMSTDHVEDHQG